MEPLGNVVFVLDNTSSNVRHSKLTDNRTIYITLVACSLLLSKIKQIKNFKRKPMKDLIFVAIFIGAYILLQMVILPKLGISS